MSLKDTFCSSPWFHVSIDNDGQYRRCRWHMEDIVAKDRKEQKSKIHNESPLEYFQNGMKDFRQDMLNGTKVTECSDCYLMDQHNKVSGRSRQLLKAGILTNQFEKTTLSSPMLEYFKHSQDNNGHTTLAPLDWQIDLGNYCNSGCVMCSPEYSSTLATEWIKLGLVDQLPPKTWTSDPELIETFLDDLAKIDHPGYIHLLGGETVITPAFETFLKGMVARNINQKITLGFTTNLTVWRQDIVDLLKNFSNVNLGMSIESMTPLNDYVRYPSNIDVVKANLEKWLAVADEQGWLKQIRITPTCLSILHLDTVYDYAYERNVTVESCNFISKPEYLRISLLDQNLRDLAINKLESFIASKDPASQNKVINTRDPSQTKNQILQDAQSYITYLKQQPITDDVRSLVEYLKKIESNRNNSILNYLPEYEQFLRTAGY
jgi:Zn-finger protein